MLLTKQQIQTEVTNAFAAWHQGTLNEWLTRLLGSDKYVGRRLRVLARQLGCERWRTDDERHLAACVLRIAPPALTAENH